VLNKPLVTQTLIAKQVHQSQVNALFVILDSMLDQVVYANKLIFFVKQPILSLEFAYLAIVGIHYPTEIVLCLTQATEQILTASNILTHQKKFVKYA
jgi:hypothetical protein